MYWMLYCYPCTQCKYDDNDDHDVNMNVNMNVNDDDDEKKMHIDNNKENEKENNIFNGGQQPQQQQQAKNGLYCICLRKQKDGDLMLECIGCTNKNHPKCLKMGKKKKKKAKKNEKWKCIFCKDVKL